MKLKVAVIYGSRTCEHDVSIVSALQAMDNLNRSEYDVVPVYIARDGQWYTGQMLRNIAFYSAFRPSMVTRVAPVMSDDGKLTLMPVSSIAPHGVKGMLKVLMSNMNLGEETVEKCDVVLPVMHGMNGEDGTLQGLLELFNVPYTSSGVLGSALGMDKIAMKQFFKGCDLPVLDGMWFARSEWTAGREGVLSRIESTCPYPVYVKPANLGSSIGISRATDRPSLIKAIETAVEYDRRILVERGIEKPREINCSALRVKGEVRFNPWCDTPEFVKKFKTLYFDNQGEKSIKVISARPHGNVAILMLEGVDDIDKARGLKNTVLYMKRSDASLPDGVWFIQELIDCTVTDCKTGETLGTVADVSETGANDVWHIKTTDGREVLIPAVKEVVMSVDVKNGIIKINPLKGLFDDED